MRVPIQETIPRLSQEFYVFVVEPQYFAYHATKKKGGNGTKYM